MIGCIQIRAQLLAQFGQIPLNKVFDVLIGQPIGRHQRTCMCEFQIIVLVFNVPVEQAGQIGRRMHRG